MGNRGGEGGLGEDEDGNPKADQQAEDILKALLHSVKPGSMDRPRKNTRLSGRTLTRPEIFGLVTPGGYQMQNTTLKTVSGVQDYIDKAAPKFQTREPYMTETLKKVYAKGLASATKEDASVYKPVSDNYYQRLAAMYKQRLREESLYNAGN